MPTVSPTMFTNIFICIAIALTVYFSGNPMAIIALFFLQPEPSHQFLTGAESSEETEDAEGSPIGFL